VTPNLYTSSRLKVLRSCPRLHHYRYELGIQTLETDSMRFGTAAHKALEAWLLAWQLGAPAGRLDAALATLATADISTWDRARLTALIAAYDARWGESDWEVLAVEVEFRYELDGHIIGGKCDAIIRDRSDGRVWVLEHKTTSQDAAPGSAYWERLAIDTQVSIYVDGATMLGHDIAGVIYDVLQRPRHEPKLATPDAEREYTQGRGCKGCGGSAKAGAIVQGRGFYTVGDFDGSKEIACEGCAGTGWKLDKDGKPDAPRLYANQREHDETVEAFLDRVVDEIAENPNAFLIRGDVVRLEDELPRMRADLIDTIRMERTAAVFGIAPRNPDACNRFGALCPMFALCSGRAGISDFTRGEVHPELAA